MRNKNIWKRVKDKQMCVFFTPENYFFTTNIILKLDAFETLLDKKKLLQLFESPINRTVQL